MLLKTEFELNVPRYTCEMCYDCKSKMGTSMNSIKSRGCCYYFPKYNLYDIQKMSKSTEGLETLDYIIKTKGTSVHKYHIETKGIFEEDRYKEYLKSLDDEEDPSDYIKDKSVYFKSCAFVVDGKGCTIKPQYRNPVCNFYLCNELKDMLHQKGMGNKINDEAASYWKFYNRENEGLAYLLKDLKINLRDNFDEVIKALNEAESYEYEFPNLEVKLL